MDLLADKIGCKPKFRDLMTDPALAYRYIFGGHYPPFYRLVGPHVWKGARDAIFRAPANTTEPTKTRLVKRTYASESLLKWMLLGSFVLVILLITIF